MREDRRRWEERYAGVRSAGQRHAADEPPSDFLVQHAGRLNGRILDVAAGAGRNALFLTRQGNVVDAVDIAFAGLRMLSDRARAEGLQVHTVQADLESFPLPHRRYDAVINVRYLQRSLFEPIQQAVRPGGVILFDTFLIDQQTVGHPSNPEFLLQRGELRAAFRRCEILVYEEGLFETGSQSAYLARMLARRPAEGVD